MATCPRCGARFQFRELKKDDKPAEPSSPEQVSPAAQTSMTQAADMQAKNDDNSLPPGAIIPEPSPKAAEPESSQKEENSQGSQQAEAELEKKESLWKATLHQARDTFTQKSEDDYTGVPWEQPEKYGLLNGFYQTVLRVMFQPARFFAALPGCRGRLTRAILFYLLLGLLQTIVKLLWLRNALAPMLTDPQVQEMLSATSMSMSFVLLMTPVLLFVQLFVYALMFFLMLRLVQPERVNFNTVLRIIAYSAAPLVVSVVPVVGSVVAMVWFAVSCLVGCRFALGISWIKVLLALIPLYAIAFAVSMQVMMQLAAL